MSDRTFSVKDLCERYSVGEHTVLGWIRRRELKAFSVSRKASGKPKWRVTPEALGEFEQSRTPTPSPPPARRRQRAADIIEFYK